MNLKQALEYARTTIRCKNIEDAALEGEVLLRHVLGIDRACLFSRLDEELIPRDESALNSLIERRCQGEPTAYITGHREFYGLDFIVDHRVLIPRPESELLVTKAIDIARNNRISRIADIGTGSGAIAISIAVHLPEVTVYGTDISSQELEVAAVNCAKHGVSARVVLLQGDMLGTLPGPVDIIIANLPYVKRRDLAGDNVLGREPALALDGGEDGLEKITDFSHQVRNKISPGGCLMLEIGQGQAGRVKELLRTEFPSAHIEVGRDLAGIERVVNLCLT